MSATARHLRNGALSPWAVDYFNGVAEQEHLRAQGLSLDLDPYELHALGVAIADQHEGNGHAVGQDQDPVLSDEASQALDRVVADRDHRAFPSWAEEYARHQGHRHARNETCTVLDQAQAQTAPEIGTTVTPDIPGSGSGPAPDQGQGDHHGREQ
jgi:hypothetical protein